MRLGDPDASKRPRPIPIEGSEFTLEFDTVISAIGQRPDIPVGFNISFDQGTEMNINPAQGVFVGGDLLTGPKTVIDAIASGRRGAVLVDRFLGGEGHIVQEFTEKETSLLLSGTDSVNIDQHRLLMPQLSIPERSSNFSEVCLGFDDKRAIEEAKRCLGCDMRFRISPVVLPPERWLVFSEENIQDLPETEGVYVLYDEQKEIYQITGVENIRQELMEEVEKGGVPKFFSYEEDQMYTAKERQLIQQYMKKHGKMPIGNDELDDLF